LISHVWDLRGDQGTYFDLLTESFDFLHRLTDSHFAFIITILVACANETFATLYKEIVNLVTSSLLQYVNRGKNQQLNGTHHNLLIPTHTQYCQIPATLF